MHRGILSLNMWLRCVHVFCAFTFAVINVCEFCGRVAKYCDEYVCLSVCMHNLKTVQQNFIIFFCMMPVTMAQSFSDSVAIHYLLPVSQMTSCFHSMGPVANRCAQRCVASRHQWTWCWPCVGCCSTLAHWLSRQACCGASAGLGAGCLAAGLGYCRDGRACFAVCFMLVVICALGW